MVAVTPNWRDIPPTTLAQWRKEFEALGSPLLSHADPMYSAAGTHSALVLAFLWREQLHWTWPHSPIPKSYNNPLSMKSRTGDGSWQQFASPTDNVVEWVRRLTDPNGPYRNTVSLDDLCYVYAPPNDNNDTPAYIRSIKDRLAAMPTKEAGPVSSLNMTRDLIPLPDGIIPSFAEVADKPEGTGWNNLGKRTVRGVSIHRMQGTLDGTNQYFGDPNVGALTDFGIDHITGRMRQWVDPEGYRSGWASGKFLGAYGDGLAFAKKYGPITGIGADVINRDRVSLEVSGWFYAAALGRADLDDPVSMACLQRMAQFIAHYAHNYGITHKDFPIAPWDGFSFICWHHEFTAGTGKICPGQRIMDLTAQLIEMTRAIMKAAQTGTKPSTKPVPTYAPIVLLDLGEYDGKDRVMPDGTVLHAVDRIVRARRKTPRLQVADQNGKRIGPDINKNEEFRVIYELRPQNTGSRFLYTPHGTRVIGSHVDPYISITDKP